MFLCYKDSQYTGVGNIALCIKNCAVCL